MARYDEQEVMRYFWPVLGLAIVSLVGTVALRRWALELIWIASVPLCLSTPVALLLAFLRASRFTD